jgi:hypothetical protein
MTERTAIRLLHLFALLGASACAADSRAARVPDRLADRTVATVEVAPPEAPVAAFVAQQGDTGARHVTLKPRVLTDAEQRVADGIVFAPGMIERFVVASRAKRLLLDIGRIDLEAKLDAPQLALVRRVAGLVGPLSRVAFVRVQGSWGQEIDSIAGYDVWNGRAVAVLVPSPRADSLLRKGAPLLGVATRILVPADSSTARDSSARHPSARDSSARHSSARDSSAAVAGGCVRDSVPAGLPARVALVRDSLVRWVTDSLKPSYAVAGKLAVRGDTVSGCFGAWRAAVVVTTRTPSFDWSEERTLLVAPDGKVAVGRLRDLRLRTHDSLVAFDADGDGIDELAARGLAQRMGAQTVLKLDPATRRFSRFASGFAWETR